MAIIVRFRIPSAAAEDHDRLEREIETRFATLGGPADGLMVHLGYPDGNDLVIVQGWRTQDLFDSSLHEVFQPALAAAGLHAEAPDISPAFSIARP
jgi:hypothetical protein